MLKEKFDNPKILAILTVFFWSFSSLLAKLISIKSPFLLFSISFVFALIIYILYAFKTFGNNFIRKLKKIPAKYFFIGLSGYYAVWLGNTMSFRAYDSAAETTVLNYTWLIFTVFFAEIFFNKQKKKNLTAIIEYLGILAAFASVFVLSVKGNVNDFEISNTKGLAWGLFGGLSYGFFSAYSSTISKENQSIFLISAISSGLIAMLITAYFFNGNLISQIKNLTLKDIALTAALGILVDALGYIMWTRSLTIARNNQISVSKIVSIIFILPVSSLIVISIFLKEYTMYKPYFLVSIFFLLIGSFLSQKSKFIANRIKG